MKPVATFHCSACGAGASRWVGQCPQCGEWNTLERREGIARTPAGRPARVAGSALQAVPSTQERLSTGQEELDRVLGGGIVPGSVTLLGGDPGIGKSTLLLQVAAHVSGAQPVLYASGEESSGQIGLRAARLGLTDSQLSLVTATELAAVLEEAEGRKARLLIVDSIQTLGTDSVPGSPGAVAQLRACTAELVRFAKSALCAVVIVGHVTKEGTIAGPRVLEHLVDAVLYFESEATSRYRIVRAVKNRFGAAHELGFFAMTAQGLKEVRNPAAIFLARAAEPAAGSIVTVTREGGRPLLIELQALVDRMRFGAPRRIAQGLDANRVAMLLAVLSRHAGVSLQEHDVFVNAVGGMRIEETGWDLPVAVALASSLRDRPLPRTLAVFGELGLTGEVRPVAYGEDRLREAARQGFDTVIIPRDNAPRRPVAGVRVVGVSRVDEALAAAFG